MADLPVAGSLSFVFTAELVNPDVDQELVSQADVAEPIGVIDPVPANNTAQATIRTGIFADGFEGDPLR